MDLKAYFEGKNGIGVLSTAGADGKVDAAVYSRPHILEDGTVAMIMRDRLSHKNLTENPHAAYLFKEDGPGYAGKRLFLTRIREEEGGEMLASLQRRCPAPEDEQMKGPRYLVIFKIDQILPLVGGGNDSSGATGP